MGLCHSFAIRDSQQLRSSRLLQLIAKATGIGEKEKPVTFMLPLYSPLKRVLDPMKEVRKGDSELSDEFMLLSISPKLQAVSSISYSKIPQDYGSKIMSENEKRD